MDKIILRPSAIDGFYGCPKQWYETHIKGRQSIPSLRAAIGTAVHAGVETGWTDSMKVKTKIFSVGAIEDAAMEAFKEEEQKGLVFDEDLGESRRAAESEIRSGLDAFVEDIVPFTDIPDAVEQRYTVEIDHPVIAAVSGTVDYIKTSTGVIADVKTSKRKPVANNYVTQQSVYRFLAESKGIDIKHNQIQGVTFGAKGAVGHIIPLNADVPHAKVLMNDMLDVLDVYHEDKVSPEVLFRGNPNYMFCSPKYCAFYKECKYAKGE